ncbi:MAG: OmpA family protein [Maribacter sp.]|uniref:OmpA family protein n=1 Tax=Maribacter sp. TaxID=1897614 RepID=UPI003296DD4F
MKVLAFIVAICLCLVFSGDLFGQETVSRSKDSLMQYSVNYAVEKMVSDIGNIYFDSGSFELDKRNEFKLNKLVQILDNHPTFEILVVAHSDTKGTVLYNQKLSEKRAEIVKRFLIKGKVSENRIYIESFGENRPKNKCDETAVCDAALHRENRRVEFVVFSD